MCRLLFSPSPAPRPAPSLLPFRSASPVLLGKVPKKHFEEYAAYDETPRGSYRSAQDQRLSSDARRAQVGGYSEAAGGGCEAYAHDAAGGYDDDAVQIGICSHGW